MSKHKDTVVIIHGSLMSPSWMMLAEYMIEKQGFHVINLGYKTHEFDTIGHADNIYQALMNEKIYGKLSFFGFSLGGLISWTIAERYPELEIHRMVLAGSPNQGSEIADYMDSHQHWRWLFRFLFGKVKDDLKAINNPLLPHLGPIDRCEVGLIGGKRPGVHHLLAGKIPSPNDGLVSEQSLAVDWAKDIIMMDVSHTELIFRRSVINQAIEFIKHGQFNHRPRTK